MGYVRARTRAMVPHLLDSSLMGPARTPELVYERHKAVAAVTEQLRKTSATRTVAAAPKPADPEVELRSVV